MARSFMPAKKEGIVDHLKRAAALLARDEAAARLDEAVARFRARAVEPALARTADMRAVTLAALTRAELLALFDKLDRVQQQIDELSA